MDYSILTSVTGKVYFIVVNGIIYKIGGSNCNGGIKIMLNAYFNGHKGNPSKRSFGICSLMMEEIQRGSIIEIYMIPSKNVSCIIDGLFSTSRETISAYKEMEDKCLEDFKEKEEQYPLWNFQENRRPWPQRIVDEWDKLNESYSKSKKIS